MCLPVTPPPQVNSPRPLQVDPPPLDPPPLPPVSSDLLAEMQRMLARQRLFLGRQLGASLVEPRLGHIGSYAIRSGASESLIRAVLLSEVAEEAEGMGR